MHAETQTGVTTTGSAGTAQTSVAIPAPPGGSDRMLCNQLTNRTPVPRGYGASWDVTSRVRTMIMNVFCENEQADIVLGDRSNALYIYNIGYDWSPEKKAWQKQEWRGKDPVGSWLRGSAEASVRKSASEIQKDNFVLAYMCKWNGNDWKCGCRDATCAESFWQLQIYKKKSSTPPIVDETPPAVIITLNTRNVVQDELFKITYKNAGSEAIEYSPQSWCLVRYEYLKDRRWVAYDPPFKIAAPCSLEKLGSGESHSVESSIPTSAPTGAWRVVFTTHNTNFYSDVFKVRAKETDNACVITGCSGQVCVDEDTAARIITTCEYLPQYACYRNAVCERQQNGECGWTEDDDLKMCLAEPVDYFKVNTSNQAAVQAVSSTEASSI